MKHPDSYPPCAYHPRGRHSTGPMKGGEGRHCALCGLIFRSGATVPGKANTRGGDLWRKRLEVCKLRDGPSCFYCQGPAVPRTGPGPREDHDAVLDHFIPRSRGGSDRVSNRRISCRVCDLAKGDQMPWEFMPERFAKEDAYE